MTKSKGLFIHNLLFPEAHDKKEFIKKNALRFVHYTSAEAATQIIKNGKFWLRDATCMNDLREAQHGFDCLVKAYNGPEGQKFQQACDNIHSGSSTMIANIFDRIIPNARSGTYVACFSEHDDKEDTLGRLSMWRAYSSPSAGVALVLKNEPFFNEEDIIGAYTSNVSYLDEVNFENQLSERTKTLCQASASFKDLTVQEFVVSIINLFYFSVFSTKHPGFGEEREWRIIYSPSLGVSEHIKETTEVIREIPQIVQSLELRRYNDNLDLSISKILDRVIIGPTQFPEVQKRVFIKLLEAAGVEDAKNKVHLTSIPLRT